MKEKLKPFDKKEKLLEKYLFFLFNSIKKKITKIKKLNPLFMDNNA